MKLRFHLLLCLALLPGLAFGADVKVSQLPAASTPLSGAELLPIVQSSTTKKATTADVAALGTVDSIADSDTTHSPSRNAVFDALALKANASVFSVYGLTLVDDVDAATARSTLGLGNVDNTSDASKPISTATQTALDLKAPLASPTFTGTVSGITAAMVGAPSGSGTSTGTNTGDQTSVTGNAGTATALAANGSNCSAGSFPLGVDAGGAAESCTSLPTTISGTANQITASGSTGAITLSIPSSPTLPGTTTGTFSGNLTGNVTGNASTATALAANGANCSAGNYPLGVDASGAVESCTAVTVSFNAPTTADSNADYIIGASAVGKKPLVLQSKASNTASVFQTQYSDGALMGIDVQRDGNVVIDQKFGNVASKPLQIKYQTNEKAYIDYTGNGSFNGGLTVNGLWTVSATGDVLARDFTARHVLATGTSPTIGGSCGTSPAIAGKDSALKITTGTGSPTSCTATFGTSWTTAPVCVAAATSTTALNVATTTTTVVVSASALAASEVLHVVCHGF